MHRQRQETSKGSLSRTFTNSFVPLENPVVLPPPSLSLSHSFSLRFIPYNRSSSWWSKWPICRVGGPHTHSYEYATCRMLISLTTKSQSPHSFMNSLAHNSWNTIKSSYYSTIWLLSTASFLQLHYVHHNTFALTMMTTSTTHNVHSFHHHHSLGFFSFSASSFFFSPPPS